MDSAAWFAARALVLRYGWNAAAYQILNPGMRLWFSAAGDAVAGYVVSSGVRVVAGAPVCAPGRLRDVALELEDHSRRCGTPALFFGAGTRLEAVYAAESRHSLIRLGAQPVWDPRTWAANIQRKGSLRAQLHRARNKRVRISEWDARRAGESAALRRVLRAWLDTRGLPSLGFLVTPDLLGNLADRRVFVADRDGDVVAFLVATPIPAREGWLVEQWPRAPHAPNGTTHLLVDAAMRAVAASGSRYATLGLAPLSDEAGVIGEGQARWLRMVLHWVRAHGRRFYNFRGLEAFKRGMEPTAWEPIFAIAPNMRFTPRMLHAVSGAFSGGSPEWLVARAVGSAVMHELHRLPGTRRRLFHLTPREQES